MTRLAVLALAFVSVANLCNARGTSTLSPSQWQSVQSRIQPSHAKPVGGYEVRSFYSLSPHTFEVFPFPDKEQPSDAAVSSKEQEDAAFEFVRQKLGIADDMYVFKDSDRMTKTGVMRVHLKQAIGGIEVGNGDIAVHVDMHGRVVAYSNSFYNIADGSNVNLWPETPLDVSGVLKAFILFAESIQLEVNARKVAVMLLSNPQDRASRYLIRGVPLVQGDIEARQAYIHSEKGTLEAAWEFFIDLNNNYLHPFVSINNPRVIALCDWTANAGTDYKYNVVKLGTRDPVFSGRSIVTDPVHGEASLEGWNSIGDGQVTDTTIGNNVQAHAPGRWFFSSLFRPKATNGVFDFLLDLGKHYIYNRAAAVVNLFYMCNILHDLFYAYGFTEATGNFQTNNWGRGGLGNDAIVAIAQSSVSTKPAQFITPPDGIAPRMNMFIWDVDGQQHDTSLWNDVIVHEFTHGVISRLTGGRFHADCMQTYMARGLAEGTADFSAAWMEMQEGDMPDMVRDFGSHSGAKLQQSIVYTLDINVNPLTYGCLGHVLWLMEPHLIGKVWTAVLHDLYWSLTSALGFAADKFSADITKGNTLALQLIVDGMKMQPCNPTFIEARDAIILAEQLLTSGKHRCKVWYAFAKRGLGAQARFNPIGYKIIEDFTLPSDCLSDPVAVKLRPTKNVEPNERAKMCVHTVRRT
ncbi:Fungalysin metallopeptidase-domain-containing protein [Thamnocephalis sphaerospora]|uniref:Extracellular metalloproteinase n=1 Tax=Thamnocephalis sphaerospora TaxID=78915 RepID=A0A4P9XWW0_9FUNG|nr:Fungalysin metallopeptidase-domain-containing protein [Thamnocephalis sphaerospora]|eukprot:RKP10151.1 Fungalysin metallopeptidase-domain-containing protein [Thamnocephalis sphaerospora]